MNMIKRWVLAIALMLSAITTNAQYDIDQFFYRGRQFLIDGKYANAIDNFNILVQLDSTLYDAYYFRGIAKSIIRQCVYGGACGYAREQTL